MSKTLSPDLAAAIAAYKGEVKRVPEGERAYDAKDVWRARQNGGKAAPLATKEADDAEQAYWRRRDAFDEARYMGASVDDALKNGE